MSPAVVFASSSSNSSLTFGIAFAVIAVVLFIALLSWYYSPREKAKRALRAAPARPIADLAPGVVGKAVGTVALTGDALEAPISKRPCAHYEVRVEQHRSSGKSSHWHTILREERSIDFLLRDASGVARIDMRASRVVSVVDVKLRSGSWNDATPELEAFLARRSLSSKGLVFNKTLRYSEGVIEAGERVAVLGLASTEADPDPTAAGSGYRGTPERCVIGAPPGGEVVVSDDESTLSA